MSMALALSGWSADVLTKSGSYTISTDINENQEVLRLHCPGVKTAMTYKSVVDNCATATRKATQKKRSGEEAGVECVFNFKEFEDYDLMGIGIGNYADNFWQKEDLFGETKYAISDMGKGTYTLAAIFASETLGNPIRIIVKEDVSIDSDCEITFDPSEATEYIQFEGTLPNGERIIAPLLGRYNTVKEEGNVFCMEGAGAGYYYNCFSSRRFGCLLSSDGALSREIIDGKEVYPYRYSDFIISPGLSDDIFMTQFMIQLSKDQKEAMLMQGVANGTGAQTVTNDSEGWVYTDVNQFIDKEPMRKAIGDRIETETNLFGCFFSLHDQEIWMTNIEGDDFNYLQKLAYCLPTLNTSDSKAISIMPYSGTSFYGTPVDYGDYQLIPTWQLVGPIRRQTEKDMTNIVVPMIVYPYTNDLYYESDGMLNMELVNNGVPSFGSLQTECKQKAGNSVPFIEIHNQVRDRLGQAFIWTYNSRLGEYIQPANSCRYVAEWGDKKIDVVADNDENEKQWLAFNDAITNAAYYGTIHEPVNEKIILSNPVIIDGLNTESIIDMVWDYSKNEFPVPPELSMLQFRTTDGVVTDHFENADEATVSFSGGVFKYNSEPIFNDQGDLINVKAYYSYVSTPEASVEYAPYGSDEWMPVATTCHEDKFFMPYGAYWTGSLKDVDRFAENGWFDIRIKLADDSGNSCVTTISPAFRIEELDGVTETNEYSEYLWYSNGCVAFNGPEDSILEVYSPNGCKLYSTKGNKIDINVFDKGMYIVKAYSKNGQYCKKIIL